MFAYPQSRKRDRRGNILILTAIAMVPMCGMIAFAVDWGALCSTKADLQRTADAAAMAGIWELLEARDPGSNLSQSQAKSNTRLATREYAMMNTAYGRTVDLLHEDIEIGYFPNPLEPSGALQTSNFEKFNTVRVTSRRDASVNGPLELFFAKVLGHDDYNVEATATAIFVNDIAGFEAPRNGGNAPILPFALAVETWESALDGEGEDNWTWNAELEVFEPGGDGIPEVNLYPQETGSSSNNGTVNIGTSNNSTSFISNQILNGVSPADLDYHGGDLTINDTVELNLDGDPGISNGFKNDLAAIIGEPRVVPVFDDFEGNGNNSSYTISQWAGIRIVEVSMTGNDKRVMVQPSKVFIDGGVIPGTTSSSNYVFSRVWLTQ